MSITLTKALNHADEVEIDGFTFTAEYSEIRRNYEGTGYLFDSNDDSSVFLPDQVLKQDGDDFIAKKSDGEEVAIRFIKVIKTNLSAGEILANEALEGR